MAEVVPEKSRGLKFAEQQLLRHGWEQGKGLGREENGICEAIKVNVKCGKGGVGHKEGDQFTFHWWDHVFNKASSSLQVESDQDGIKLTKTVEEDEDGMISNKRPRKAWLAKDKLYGCFVKSATLLSGQEQPEPKASESDDSSSSSDEEDDWRLDLSSTTKLSDADLMKACGGRTAHKGARHGLNMSAKLARLEQQEAEFMAKYGKKSQPPAASPVCGKPAPPTSKAADERAEQPEETADEAPSTKMKKKRKSSTPSVIQVSESPGAGVNPKKKKKKKKADEEVTDAVSTEDVICVENGETEQSHKTKRKQKKKKKNKAEQNEEEITTSPAAESESPEETAELHSVTKEEKKKKKKSSKHHSEVEESNETESSQSEPAQDCAPRTKKRKAAVLMEEAEVAEVESTVKQKRTKCKKDKPVVDDKVNEEAPAPKKKKKKKKCKE
ncbi:G patch domain-containing protein 4 [Pleuronectes platessa]|uniref:G patch domain-containing protein 4 n=1 Tax=Pleuronectes platessa TaxID=8262 RepID=UPI00232A533F|nr:G patch domain-containing protein 4 [Pleuronectes platessa]